MAERELLSRRGWQVIRLTSPTLAVEVVPALGGTVLSVRRLADDLELLDHSPWGLPLYGAPLPGGTAEVLRHDLDPGGWQSLFPNGGDTVTLAGAEQGFDGEVRIAHFELDDSDADQSEGDPSHGDRPEELRLRTRLRRTPFEVGKIISVDDDTVTITETVRNVGSDPREIMWGSRLRFGAPLISEDAEVEASASLVHPDAIHLYNVDYDDVTPWPRTPGADSMINLRFLPKPGSENRVAYLTDLTEGTATITNRTIDCTATLDWDLEQLPYLWYQLEAGDTDDHPWFGRGYFLDLTPNSSWPAHGVHDARRISSTTVKIDPDEERTARVSLRVGRAG